MPPRRRHHSPNSRTRGRRADSLPQQVEVEAATADAAPSAEDPSPASSISSAAAPPPFFSTSFSTHRVSPLYIGPEALTDQRLQTLSQRLRDTLVGDVVRGVEVGLEGADGDGAMGRAGALELVTMRLVRLDEVLGQRLGGDAQHGRPASRDLSSDAPQGLTEDGPGGRAEGRKGIHISLRYEHALFTGLLLPLVAESPDDASVRGAASAPTALGREPADKIAPTIFNTSGRIPTPDGEKDSFLLLPLLLLRMPAPLKPVVMGFLCSAFDCRISSLVLGTRTLVRFWECWMADTGPPTRGPFAKDVVLTLGFLASSILESGGSRAHQNQVEGEVAEDRNGKEGTRLGIKAIDVIIPAQDLRRFVKAGRTLEKQERISKSSRKRRLDKAGSPLSENQETRKRRRLAGGKDEEGWTWRRTRTGNAEDDRQAEGEVVDQPFTDALAHYLDHHLALDMFHPTVRVLRIACGGFVASEGRIKIFGGSPAGSKDISEIDGGMPTAHRRAAWGLFEGLAARARGRRVARA